MNMKERPRAILARWAAVAALTAGPAGCGESRPDLGLATYPAQGKVVLAGGEPLTSGIVVFVPEGGGAHPISGAVGPDGTFHLTTDGVAPGAPAGEYKVRLEIDPDSSATATGVSPRKRGGLPFPAKYSKESTSGLTATVKAEPANELPPFVLN